MTATKNILVLVLTLMTSSLFAQPPGGGNRPAMPSAEERVDQLVEKLDKAVSLSENQKESSKTIFASYFETMQKNMKPGTRPSKEDMEEANSTTITKLKAFLDADQIKKFEKIESEFFQAPERRSRRKN